MSIANLTKWYVHINKFGLAAGRVVGSKDLCDPSLKYEVLVNFEDIKEFLPSASTNNRRDEIIRLLDCMSADERTDIFVEYCMHCGDKNPRCQCWNDE